MRSSLTKGRLHFAAHSHHPWPEVTQAAQNQYWLDSTKHLDSKWNPIFSEVMPQARKYVAQLLGIKDSTQVIEGTNTFEFVGRLFSCLDFSKPIRVLTTDSEFYSFSRVANRLTENTNIKIDFVPTQPFATFEERFVEKAKSQNYELIFSSLVFFNSGFYATRLLEKLDQLNSSANLKTGSTTQAQSTKPQTIIAIDLYHACGAVPLELEKYAQKMFFMGGSYKYLSSGEGACFLTVPKNCELRPWQTGWFADYKSLENGVKDKISYSNDGHRFAGATYDPTPWYRFNAVVKWWDENSLTPATIHDHVRGLQAYFIKQLATHKTQWDASDILGYQDHKDWANFLALKTVNPQKVVQDLRAKDIFVDARNEYVRFGFGYYQSTDDIDQLFKVLVQYEESV